jgi:hypothetical protein
MTILHAATHTVLGALIVAGGLTAGCGADDPPATRAAPVIDPGDGGRYRPAIGPADFVDAIDHPYLPFRPGARWVYEHAADGEVERIEVEVTNEQRQVFGVTAVVVRDRVSVGGGLVEDTRDWYAQDRAGNVWYLGEETAEYEDGRVVTTAGSWEAGVDGALPGIVMPARPRPGQAYRQEFYRGEAEDMAEVVRVNGRVRVPVGAYEQVLVTREWTPLEPDVVEEKRYAPGIGLVEEQTVRGDGTERTALVEFSPGSAA